MTDKSNRCRGTSLCDVGRVRIVFVIVFIGLVGACASSNETTANPVADNQLEPSEPADAGLVQSQFPVDDLLEQLFGTADVDTYLAQVQRTIGDLVQTCMQDKGFEYLLPPELLLEVDTTDRSTRAFAASNGFGVVSDFVRLFIGTNGRAFNTQDVNQPYLASLSAPQIASFLEALDGTPADPGQIQTNTGCQGSSGDLARVDWDRFNDALPQFSALPEEIDAHPGMIDIRSQWSSCMRDSGFEYLDLDDVERDVTLRLEELFASAFRGGIPVVQTDAGLAFTPEANVVLEDLAAFERSVASVNWDCQDRLRNQIDAVGSDVQRTFTEIHQTTIVDLLGS